jgi:hypothetical protein
MIQSVRICSCRPSNSELSSATVKLMPSHHPAQIISLIKNKSIHKSPAYFDIMGVRKNPELITFEKKF